MPKLKDVCRHIRSKNAGPFWVTFDLFFKSDEDYALYCNDPALGPDLFAKTYGANPDLVQVYQVPSLNVVKISYPRVSAQGGALERDLHSGQQFVLILDVELGG